MTELFISPEYLGVPEPYLLKPEGMTFMRRGVRPTLQGLWINSKGEAIGEPIELPQTTVSPVEITDGEGGYRMGEAADAVSLDVDVPLDAAHLRVILGDDEIISEIPLLALGRSSPGPWKEMFFPEEGGDFCIDVISERFNDEVEFFSLVKGLYEYWTTEHLPFKDDQIKAVFRIRALFWPSDVTVGNFHTIDSKKAEDTRILKGTDSVVRAYQKATGHAHDFALVLINSKLRAGAGGAVFPNDWKAAWMTITPKGREDWRAIALHELGHAFGLADEYETAYPTGYTLPVTHFEPNVSTQGVCGHAPEPWAKMCEEAPQPYARLFTDPRLVKVIRGARYSSTDWYRPHETCLMRTTTEKLCPVCVEYLGQRLLGRIKRPEGARL